MRKFLDVSHIIEDGLITYRGLPAPHICDFLTREASKSHYSNDTSFQIGKIEMVVNSGTYIDAPFHRYAEGSDISQLDIASLAGLDAIKVIIPEDVKIIDRSYFDKLDINSQAVIIQTNWSRFWNSESYYQGHPFLTEDAAMYLRDKGVSLVGIDSLNIDDTSGGERPVHSILLGADILIVEHLCNLKDIPEFNFKFSAVPVKVKGVGSFPVRAFVEF